MSSDIHILRPEDLSRLDLFSFLQQHSVHIHGITYEAVPKGKILPTVSEEETRLLYHFIVLTRRTEEKVAQVFRQGLIPGTAFIGRGSEGTVVGSAASLRADDGVTPLHRHLGVHLVRGVPMKQIFAQFLGRRDGPTRGRDGNSHMGNPAYNILGMISHLGTMMCVAAGWAFAARYVGSDGVAMTYIGDGATSTGDFHEAINYAAVHSLPLIVLIDNNQWGYGTPTSRQHAVPFLAMRAIGYGIEGFLVDGMDARAVYGVCKEAVARCRRGEGPFLIESLSMRMLGHSEYDRYQDYVPPADLERWQTRDPVDLLEQSLLTEGVLSEEEMQKVHEEADRVIAQGLEEALESPIPRGEEALEAVYAG